MSHYSDAFCSDEELLEELRKLGYDEVSPEVFSMMKEDLNELVENEHSHLKSDDGSDTSYKASVNLSSDTLNNYSAEEENDKSLDVPVSRKSKKKSQNSSSFEELEGDKFPSLEASRGQNKVTTSKTKKSSNSSPENIKARTDDAVVTSEISPKRYNNTGNKLKLNDNFVKLHSSTTDVNRNEDTMYNGGSRSLLSKENDFYSGYSVSNDRLSLNTDTSVTKNRSYVSKGNKFANSFGKNHDMVYSFPSPRISSRDNPLKNVKDAFKTFKLDRNFSESDESLRFNYRNSDFNLNTSHSSTNSEVKTIKRKVLRRRNGRSIITEEILEIPSIFDTSYQESDSFNNSKSFSSDDLSCKSNSSTGSINAVSPDSSLKSSPSTFSLLSTRSTSLRVPNPRKKKSDPVAMYGYYRKFWDNFKPPGEKTHDKLRWAVRDKMLEYNL